MKRLIRAASILVVAIAALTSCQSRGGVPPNGLTAILRSIPREVTPGPISLTAGDPAEVRRSAEGLTPIETTPGFTGDGWIPDDVEAWLEVTPAHAPSIRILVGDFNSRSVISALESQGYTRQKVELTEILERAGEAVGVAPGRLIYGTPEAVNRIAAFRGGSDSMLDIPWLKDVAIASGHAGAFAVYEPASGCPAPAWVAAATRYDKSDVDAGLIWYYPDAEQAARADRELERQLPPRLPAETTLRLSDARNRQAAMVLDSTRSGARNLIEATHPKGPFEGLPECPK